jgi:glutathione-regulated potassium-efflux system ancillary protein KefF
MYWYSVPGLLKHWFDKVLVHGFAYGEGGRALKDKTCLWVTTTGGDEAAFSQAGMHAHPFAAFVPPIEQTARFCGMHWVEPIIVHGAHRRPEGELIHQAAHYRTRLLGLSAERSAEAPHA